MSTSLPILSVESLNVSYGKLRALEDISLTVNAGEQVALLGHNGAGKSTLFKAVLGFISRSAGQVAVAGAAPGSAIARMAISYLPEAVAFPKTLSGGEVMTYFAHLKGKTPRQAAALLDRVGLAAAAKRRVGDYSKGMRQRLGLAQALIGRPKLMLLDEPTSGLDPLSRLDFYEIIAEVAAEGTAVLLSSHALTEVEARTDRVAILAHGRLVADAPMSELSRRASLPVRIRVEAQAEAVEVVHGRMGGQRVNGCSVVLSCVADEKVQLLSQVAALGSLISDIEVIPPSLDDVYRHYSNPAVRGETA